LQVAHDFEVPHTLHLCDIEDNLCVIKI
jgi:hypothetical protein